MTAQAARLTAAAAPAMMAMVVGGPVLGLLVFGAGVMVPKAVRLIRRHKKLAKLKERGCVSEDTSLQDVADIRNMLKT